MLVQLPRRGADADRAEADPRIPVRPLLFPALLAAAATLLSCLGNEEDGIALQIDARGGEGSKVLPASANERQVLLLPFSADQSVSGNSHDYNLKLEVAEKTPVPTPPAAPRLAPARNPIEGVLQERYLRRVESEIGRRDLDGRHVNEAIRAYRSDPAPFHRFFSARRFGPPAPRAAAPSIEIESPFAGEEGAPLTGVLRTSSSRTAIYVDSRVNDSVAGTDLEAMMRGFDEVSLPRLHTLFGEESDVDGNGVINVFLAAPERIGSDVIGFFRPADLLPKGSVSGAGSNEMEIIYARTPGAGFDFELAQATVAHEAFHLINFAVKSLKFFQGTGGTIGIVESIFLNEGQAHLAEDLAGWGIGTALIARIYLQCLDLTSLAGGGITSGDPNCRIAAPGNDSIARRGGMMLLLLYMFQQMGGAQYSPSAPADITGKGVDFLRRLSTSSSSGIANLDESSEREFFSWYADFTALLALDGTGATTDPRYNLHPELKDPFTGLPRNVRIRSVRDAGRATEIVLEGPKITREITAAAGVAVDSSLFVSGAQAIRLTIPPNLETTLSLRADPSLKLGMTIVPIP